MKDPQQLAAVILGHYHDASALVGYCAVLTDGTAGTIDAVKLDADHVLRISIRGHPGFWPVSKLKLLEHAEVPSKGKD